MTIENSVSIDFGSTLVDSINVFDCRLPGVIKKVYGFCVCTGDNPAHVKFRPLKSQASLVPSCICKHYPFYALSESHTSGKGCV